MVVPGYYYENFHYITGYYLKFFGFIHSFSQQNHLLACLEGDFFLFFSPAPSYADRKPAVSLWACHMANFLDAYSFSYKKGDSCLKGFNLSG